MQDDELTDDKREIDTGGGTYVEGQVQTGGGDFVGRDKIVHETHYHYVERPASDVPYLAPNLPPHHVPRETEISALRDLLLGEERQVAVTALRGMGGIGKTTLAIALCHDKQIVDAFSDGILWATLGPQADVLSWQATWGDALGEDLSGQPNVEARAARLRSLLHKKRCLLVIDDVWDTVHLKPMQVGGPQCATLVTTRIGKVATQACDATHALDVLKPKQAIALLEQWAGEIAEDEQAIAGELAKRLGYLPLALALAGAQVQDGEEWDELLAVFHDAQGADVTLLDLDDPSMRDESLQLAFDLSLKRLSAALPEQFAMLGVFAAGREAPFTTEAAAAVWEVKPAKAKKTLKRLVRAALLDEAGEGYTLHLLLGDYARILLDETTQQAAEARHNAYYLEVAKRSEQEWQVAEAVLPQIRTAWGRVAKDDANGLFSWASATQTFFRRRGRETDYITWLEAALAAVRTAGWRTQEGWCEMALGEVYDRFGKLDKALKHYQHSLATSQETGDRDGEARTFLDIGRIHHQRGDLDEALKQYQASLGISREIGRRNLEARTLIEIGRIYFQRNELVKALEQFQASLAISGELGYRVFQVMSQNMIGRIYQQRGELDEALERFQASLAICDQVGDQGGKAFTLNYIGHIHFQCGELDEAMAKFETSLTIFRGTGQPRGEAWLLNSIGKIYHWWGNLDEAMAQFQASLYIMREVEDRSGQAELLKNIGNTYEQMDRLTEAEEHLVEALALFETMGIPEAEEVREDLERVRGQLREEGEQRDE